MNRAIAIVLIMVVGFFAAAAQAVAVTIDFEELTIGDGPASIADWVESGGYEFSGSATPGPWPDGYLAKVFTGDTGTNSFGVNTWFVGQDSYGALATVAMRKADGGAFALHSIDLLLQTDPYGGSISYSGTLEGGGAANLSTAVGTGDWLNLVLVDFTAYGDGFGLGGFTSVEIDNVNVSAVPIPAAVWLFGSALAGLGWLRRKPVESACGNRWIN